MLGAHDRYALLKDGTLAHLRDVQPTDGAYLVDGFSRLSRESRYARFFFPIQELSPDLVRYLTHVDGKNHAAVVALTADETTSLGIARFVRSRKEPTSAEFAVTVVDAAQGRGLGIALLSLLTEEAREVGILYFTALVHRSNVKIARLLRRVGATCVGSDGPLAEYRWKL